MSEADLQNLKAALARALRYSKDCYAPAWACYGVEGAINDAQDIVERVVAAGKATA